MNIIKLNCKCGHDEADVLFKIGEKVTVACTKCNIQSKVSSKDEKIRKFFR